MSVSPENYSSVDARRNLDKIGREVTSGASIRRIENKKKYFETTENLKFSPDPKVFEKAMNIVACEFGVNMVPHVDS
jgi:hypothetical protein